MKEKSYKDYLDKTFLEELNYKIWSTKGARFYANKRLLKISDISNICTSMLSVYLISIGLMSVYNLYTYDELNRDLIAYSTTCLSILILVFSQIESSRGYDIKAKKFHSCSLELSRIYNELRIYKTLNPETKKTDSEFADEISKKYQSILEKYDNHSHIDHKLFKSSTAKYHEMSSLDVLIIKFESYLRTTFIYHLLIIIPPILILSLFK